MSKPNKSSRGVAQSLDSVRNAPKRGVSPDFEAMLKQAQESSSDLEAQVAVLKSLLEKNNG